MESTFTIWISVIGAVCIGIMVLALFFAVLDAFKRWFATSAMVKIKGLFSSEEFLTVRLNNEENIGPVKFIGHTDANSTKGLPFRFHGMAVFETAAGKRILLRSSDIRMIEEIDSGAAGAAA